MSNNCSTGQNRDKVFDVFRGIAIILMVCAHAGCPWVNFIYLFHMAIFFICSGIFFNDKHIENIGKLTCYIKLKIKHLYIPFILWNGFLILIHNYLLKINFYTVNKLFLSLTQGANYGLSAIYSTYDKIIMAIDTLLFLHGEQLGGATWFLRVLFGVSVITAIAYYLGKKLIKNKLVLNITGSIFFITILIMGHKLQQTGFNYYNIGTIFSCMFLYYLGMLYQSYKNKININFYCFILSFFILFVANKYGSINIVENKYPNLLFFVMASILGFIFILYISKFISKLNLISSFISYIGKHTNSILLFHFAAFKFITYIYIIIHSKPMYYLAAFPVLENTLVWWISYSLSGVLIPLLIVFMWEFLVAKFKLLRQRF